MPQICQAYKKRSTYETECQKWRRKKLSRKIYTKEVCEEKPNKNFFTIFFRGCPAKTAERTIFKIWWNSSLSYLLAVWNFQLDKLNRFGWTASKEFLLRKLFCTVFFPTFFSLTLFFHFFYPPFHMIRTFCLIYYIKLCNCFLFVCAFIPRRSHKLELKSP